MEGPSLKCIVVFWFALICQEITRSPSKSKNPHARSMSMPEGRRASMQEAPSELCESPLSRLPHFSTSANFMLIQSPTARVPARKKSLVLQSQSPRVRDGEFVTLLPPISGASRTKAASLPLAHGQAASPPASSWPGRLNSVVSAGGELHWYANIDGQNLADVPEWVIRRQDLRVLRMHKNKLTALPSSIGLRLPQLQQLILRANDLRSLPESLFMCTRLQVLDVGENELAAVSGQCRNLVNLRYLVMQAFIRA